MMTVKASTTDICDLTPMQVQERAIMKHTFLRLPHREYMGKSLIGSRCCVKHLNKKILNVFGGSRSTTNEPNFKILNDCIHELLNVFEESAQCIHTTTLTLNDLASFRYIYLLTTACIGTIHF